LHHRAISPDPIPEEVTAVVERAIEQRLDESLHALDQEAVALMREIAAETWRLSSTDLRPEQERIVSLLSRDQTIRSLLTTNDERYQALSVRAARVEDTLADLATTGRTTREAMDASASAIREIANSPSLHGVEAVRDQLTQVEHHIASAFQHFDERERGLLAELSQLAGDHSERMAQRTSEAVGVMEEHIRSGTEAIGELAARMDQRAEEFVAHDTTVGEHVSDVMTAQIRPVVEHLQQLIETRVKGLAHLMRADSQALLGVIRERSEEQTDAVREAVDWRMAAFAARMDERLEQADQRLEQATERLALRTAEVTQATIVASLAGTLERMESAIAAVASIEGIDAMLAEGQHAIEDRLRSHIDDRISAVARLMRADNQALAGAVSEVSRQMDPEPMREIVRAIKEIQAGLANDVGGTVDRKFQVMSDQLHSETQATAESMIKVAEVLGEKIDRVAVRVNEGQSNEFQVVIDRMTEAIQAMSIAGQQRRSA
jgi:hypothetical protein